MLLTCSQCQTIFRIDGSKIAPEGQKVRCSVCSHIWDVVPHRQVAGPSRSLLAETFYKLRMPAALLLFVMLVSSVLFSFRGPLTAHFPGLISSFNGVGLTIQPNLEVLEIRNLQASYQGVLLRVRGEIFNHGNFTAHAVPLQLQVLSKDKEQLASHRLIPENRFIPAGSSTRFFLQTEISDAASAEVRVDLLKESLIADLF